MSGDDIDELLDVLAACSSSLDPGQLIGHALPAISGLLDHRVWLRRSDADEPRDATAIAVPLVCDGHDVGMLLLAPRHADTPPPPERALSAIARTLARALAHAEQFAELRASERRSWDVLDNTNAVIFVKDLDGRYTLVNRQLEADTGLPRAEILGKSDHQLFSRETAERLRADDRRVLDNGEPLEVEGVTMFPDGPHVFLTHKFPLRDANGRINGLCGIATDITARRRVEQQLLHSQKLDAVGRLAGGIAHEFNNMLTGILASAEIVELLLPKPHVAGVDEALGRIIDASERAATLARRLIAFAGDTHHPTEPVDVHGAIEGAIELLRRDLGHPAAIVLELHARASIVVGDATRLQAALLDLCLNARDAMSNGGTLTIATDDIELDAHMCASSSFTLQPGPYVEIRVRDTGIGMTPAIIEQVFEPFFTTKGASRSGLGLPAVHGTVVEHRGAIEIDSRVGRGTTVTLRLPSTSLPTPSVARETRPSPATPRKLALLVDDEPLLRTTGKRMLESIGYRVVVAADGREGVDRYTELHDELGFVLLDMVMPNMGGQAAFEAMRAIDARIPIIVCSGYAADAAVRAMQERGLAGFLAKPYRLAELTGMLTRLVARAG